MKVKALEMYFELEESLSLGDFMRHVREMDLATRDIQREPGSEHGHRAYIATLRSEKRTHPELLMEQVRQIPGVVFVEEI